jgi:hypothetical protein
MSFVIKLGAAAALYGRKIFVLDSCLYGSGGSKASVLFPFIFIRR